jgi:hypothetical protein
MTNLGKEKMAGMIAYAKELAERQPPPDVEMLKARLRKKCDALISKDNDLERLKAFESLLSGFSRRRKQ